MINNIYININNIDDVQKASLTFAGGSLVGVGCKLVQFVVYCVCLSWYQLTLKKNSSVSEEGHVLTAHGFYLVVSLASMQIKSFEIPFPK